MLKDLDLADGDKIRLAAGCKKRLLAELKTDAEFLASLGVMDYSLLVSRDSPPTLTLFLYFSGFASGWRVMGRSLLARCFGVVDHPLADEFPPPVLDHRIADQGKREFVPFFLVFAGPFLSTVSSSSFERLYRVFSLFSGCWLSWSAAQNPHLPPACLPAVFLSFAPVSKNLGSARWASIGRAAPSPAGSSPSPWPCYPSCRGQSGRRGALRWGSCPAGRGGGGGDRR